MRGNVRLRGERRGFGRLVILGFGIGRNSSGVDSVGEAQLQEALIAIEDKSSSYAATLQSIIDKSEKRMGNPPENSN